MASIFRDNTMNELFEENGFIKFSLFNSKQVSELKEYYYSIEHLQKINNDSFHSTSNSSNNLLIKDVSNFIKPYFEKELKKYVSQCEFTLSNFLVKESAPNSAVKAHIDTTLVDENKDKSFSFWVCLDDANYSTGNMQFIIGSHKFHSSLRVIPDRHQYYEKLHKVLPNYLVDVPTKAGECLVFLHSTIHSSRTNKSGKPRISCVLGGHNVGAEQFLFFQEENAPNNRIEKYKISSQSFLDLQKNQRPPHATFLGHVEYDYKFMDLNEFHQKASKKISWIHRQRNKILNKFIGSSYYT